MKQHENSFPARLIDAHAVWYAHPLYGGLLVIHAKGEVNDSCMELGLEESPLTIWPPQFSLEQYKPSGSPVCLPVLTEREGCFYFQFGTAPEEVTIIDSKGSTTIKVVVDGECDCPIPKANALNVKLADPDQRIGYSSESRQQAFDNALRQFRRKEAPEEFIQTEVVAEFGYLEWGLPVYAVQLKRMYI